MTHSRLVALSATAVALLGTAAAVWLHTITDPERLKTLARDKAREVLSRDLIIGDMKLRILPLP